ncbi:MAG: TonB-dependent receptor [Opitutaceae bacterium]|jgi:iron complex outermembrane receptor protein|nr:TonB-dependent receptor [Opitutaceae bacterium]
MNSHTKHTTPPAARAGDANKPRVAHDSGFPPSNGPGRLRALSLVAGLLLGGAVIAPAQRTASPDSIDEKVVLDTVVITTGAHVEGRTVQTSPAPIDLFSDVEIKAANQPNLLDAINILIPSFNLPSVATPNIGSMIRAGTLRGLGPDKTLVLVNGKRRHATAFLNAGGFAAAAPADLSLIPSGAIQRIEVLRDGAAAIYGSDAIAGVINIITKNNPEGGEVSYRVGQYDNGDGLTQTAIANAGFKLGAGYVNVSLQVDDRESFYRNSPVPASYLFYWPTDNVTGEPVYWGNASGSWGTGVPTNFTPDPREATRDNYAWKNTGGAAYTLKSVAASFGYPLSPSVELYGFATYGYRTSSAAQNFRPPGDDRNVRSIYPDGYAPVETISENDFDATVGVHNQGSKGWTWDLSASHGRDYVDVGVNNSLNPTYGDLSPTEFYIGAHIFDATTLNVDLRRLVHAGSLPLTIAFGGEYRREKYQLKAGEPAAYADGGVNVLDGPHGVGSTLYPDGRDIGGAGVIGAQGITGYYPEDTVSVTRDATSLYASVSSQITSALLVDLAGRYENYSDFGDTFTGRISARYDFGAPLAVRGTVSNGFHAPALAAQHYKNTANHATWFGHDISVNSPEAKALGVKPLEPEKSVNYTLGVVSQPFKTLSLAVDIYQIDLDGVIRNSTGISESAYPGVGGNVLVAAGFPAEDTLNFYANAADIRTRGIEVTLEQVTETAGWGTFRWTLSASRNYTRVLSVASTPPGLAALGIPLLSASSLSGITASGPRNKAVLGLSWKKGRFNLSVRERFYSKISSLTTAPTGTPYAGQVFEVGDPDFWLTDLDAGFQITKALNLSLSFTNLFDKKPGYTPPYLMAVNSNATYTYRNSGPVGVGGGSYSATLSYKW